MCLCTKNKCYLNVYMLLCFLIIRDRQPHNHVSLRERGQVLRPLQDDDHRPNNHISVQWLGQVLRPLQDRRPCHHGSVWRLCQFPRPHQHGSVRRYFVNYQLCCHIAKYSWRSQLWSWRGVPSISCRQKVIRVQTRLKIKHDFESSIIRGTPWHFKVV